MKRYNGDPIPRNLLTKGKFRWDLLCERHVSTGIKDRQRPIKLVKNIPEFELVGEEE